MSICLRPEELLRATSLKKKSRDVIRRYTSGRHASRFTRRRARPRRRILPHALTQTHIHASRAANVSRQSLVRPSSVHRRRRSDVRTHLSWVLSWLPFDESAGATAAARRTTRARASEHPSLHPASCPRRRSDRSSRPARRSRTAKTIPGGSACSEENLLVNGVINVEFSGPDFVSPSAGRFAPKTTLTTPVAFLLVVFSPTPTHCGV
jgi:hypothetical protein